MKKKNNAVQATAPALIGAVDPVADFINKLPRTAHVLGCKGSRTAGKSEIYVYYSYDGKTVYSTVSWEGGAL